MTCPTCSEPFTGHDGTTETTVGYFSPPGHDHDPNCMRRTYACPNGHQTELAIVRRCPTKGCDWKGRTECFCCARFVDEWPPCPPCKDWNWNDPDPEYKEQP